ncbi:hypothetical protein AB0E67_26100 [Streptomyces sp. NPDC032161]|uniref:hypothetical protein n=1 Tax=unclassified Streptomyces TaxID=2593676 RepID=UPI003403FF36
MTTPRDTNPSRRVRGNGDGTVYRRKDGRWEAVALQGEYVGDDFRSHVGLPAVIDNSQL